MLIILAEKVDVWRSFNRNRKFYENEKVLESYSERVQNDSEKTLASENIRYAAYME